MPNCFSQPRGVVENQYHTWNSRILTGNHYYCHYQLFKSASEFRCWFEKPAVPIIPVSYLSTLSKLHYLPRIWDLKLVSYGLDTGSFWLFLESILWSEWFNSLFRIFLKIWFKRDLTHAYFPSGFRLIILYSRWEHTTGFNLVLTIGMRYLRV